MMSIEEMQNIDVRTVDPDTLVDIRTIKIDQNLSREEREAEFIRQVKNPYCFRVGDVIIKFHAAVYLRLSREDGDVTDGSKQVSNSIANQNELVMDYLKSHPEITVISTYTDDGFSIRAGLFAFRFPLSPDECVITGGSSAPSVVTAFPFDNEVFPACNLMNLIGAGSTVPFAEHEALGPGLLFVAGENFLSVNLCTVSALFKSDFLKKQFFIRPGFLTVRILQEFPNSIIRLVDIGECFPGTDDLLVCHKRFVDIILLCNLLCGIAPAVKLAKPDVREFSGSGKVEGFERDGHIQATV